jgi:hypothetical protein
MIKDFPSKTSLINNFLRQRWIDLIALTLILASTAFQLSRLDTVNAGFFCDEASILFNARCIAEDGRDEHGEFMPLFFKAFGEYKSSPYIYATTVVELFFGGEPHWTARVPSAMALGVLLLCVFYLLKRQVGAGCGLFGVVVVSTQPWFSHFSQVAFELTFTPLFLCAGLLFLLRSEERNWYFMVGSALMFSLAFYNYSGARVLVPLLLLSGCLLDGTRVLRRRAVLVGWGVFWAVFILSMIPFYCNVGREGFFSRAEYLNVFTTPHIEQSAGYLWVRGLTAGWLNGVGGEDGTLFRALVFSHHYLSYYDPRYLFWDTNLNFANLRFSGGGFGLLSVVMAVGFFLGLARILSQRTYLDLFLFFWVLFYGLAGAGTWEDVPHAGRGIVGHPGIDLVVVLGWWWWWALARRIGGWRGLGLLGGMSLAFFVNFYDFGRYILYQNDDHSRLSARWMQQGFLDMMDYIEEEHRRYKEIVIVCTGFHYKPEIFALVYSGMSCREWRELGALPWKISALTRRPRDEDLQTDTLYIFAPNEEVLDPRLKQVAEFYWHGTKNKSFGAYYLPKYKNLPAIYR